MNPFTPDEIEKYRRLFPVTQNWIYLNHAAVAPLSLPVSQAIEEFTESALNQGYTDGPLWHDRVESIRKKSAELIGASADEIAFVKNTSHGLSLIAQGLSWKAGDEIIISEVEFPANVYPWLALEKRGVVVKKISVQDGELRLGDLDQLANEKTRLISLSSVQYGNGYRLPLNQVGKFCRDRGILFAVDAIQSLGAFPMDVEADNIDFLSSDAHKWMLGPEGIGLFYARKDLISKMEPALIGWYNVENALNFDTIDFKLRTNAQRFEEGSHNSLSIYALGAAVELLLEVGLERIGERILFLTDLLIDGLDDLGLQITNSLKPEYRSGIVTVRIPHDSNGTQLQLLERFLFFRKIYPSLRRGNLRFSPHFYNSKEEIEKTLSEIGQFLKKCDAPLLIPSDPSTTEPY